MWLCWWDSLEAQIEKTGFIPLLANIDSSFEDGSQIVLRQSFSRLPPLYGDLWEGCVCVGGDFKGNHFPLWSCEINHEYLG